MEPDSENLYDRERRLFDLPQLQPASSTRSKDREEVEALVLVHQDAEIVDSGLLTKAAREALKDPEDRRLRRGGRGSQHRLVGRAPSPGPPTPISFLELGGGDTRLMRLASSTERTRPTATRGEVDMVDGFVLVFQPVGGA